MLWFDVGTIRYNGIVASALMVIRAVVLPRPSRLRRWVVKYCKPVACTTSPCVSTVFASAMSVKSWIPAF